MVKFDNMVFNNIALAMYDRVYEIFNYIVNRKKEKMK